MPVVTPQRGLRIRLFASQNRRLLRRLRGFWGPDEGDEGAEGDVSSALQSVCSGSAKYLHENL